MFTRQKILLTLLRTADRPLSKTELTTWAFILRHDSPSKGGASFYDFLPHHDGPKSFALDRDLVKLEQQGHLIRCEPAQWTAAPGCSLKLATGLQHEAESVARRLARIQLDRLTQEICENHSAFALKNHGSRSEQNKSAPFSIYTCGYEGLSIDGFLFRLISNGIRHLIDVRRNPVARCYGFHRSTLKWICESLDIAYSHLPQLGIASEKRRSLETQDDYNALFADYRKSTLEGEELAVEHVTTLVKNKPSVLVCKESIAGCCHRSHLAEAVSRRANLKVDHL